MSVNRVFVAIFFLIAFLVICPNGGIIVVLVNVPAAAKKKSIGEPQVPDGDDESQKLVADNDPRRDLEHSIRNAV